MRTHFIPFLFFLLSFCIFLDASAQKKSRFFQIPGRVKMDKGDAAGVLMSVYNLEKQAAEKNENLTSSGKFDLQLNYQKEYKISFSKDGYYAKEILISTKVPAAVWKKDSIFPPYTIVVTLFQKIVDSPMSFEGKPIGKICYSPDGKMDNFDSQIYINDKDIKQELDAARKQTDLKKGEFERLVAEGNGNFEKKNYAEAISKYREGLKLKPDDNTLINKILETENLLAQTKALQAKAEEDFGKFLSSGDEFVSKKLYSESITAYRNALKIHPQDAGTLKKLSESEKSLTRISEENKRRNEEFNQLLSEGERNLSSQNYTEAIGNFVNALDRKPGDPLALSKLESARQQANKLNADRVKREQEFLQLISAGDLSFGKKNFPEAVASYKAAIQLKPADPIAVSKLASAEKMINDLKTLQAQNEEAFRILVLNGDKNMSNLQFREAVDNYKRATDINPADQPVQEKLRKAQENYSREEEFRQFLSKGDENSARKRYAEAIDFYSKASVIKTTAELRAKITAAREALAKMNPPSAPVVQKEPSKTNPAESYADQVRSGDENYSRLQYAAARFYYVEALKIKPGDSYALKKLESCDQLIRENVTAEKLKAYEELMKKAHTAYQEKNYSSARFYYRSALEILPWEKLPAEKLAEIDKLYADKLSAADQQLFRENQQKGDHAFQNKDYAVARYFYNKANEINPDEYNRSKLRQIDDLISGTEKSRREAEYKNLVDRGNEAFNRKNEAQARYYYTKALEMKPGEEYLKEQLKKLSVTK